MPNIKAAEKWVRQTQARTQHNLAAKTRLKTLYKKAASAAEPQIIRSVEGEFDKAAQKGIIHPNKAARKKSRLARAAAKPPVSAATPAAKGAGKKKAGK